MKIYIDQSGKIEQTNKVTVIAFSNKKTGSVIISASDKRRLQTIYRKAGKPRIFIIQVFSALLYFLLEKKSLRTEFLIIDQEYPGYEKLIKSYLVQLIKKRRRLSLSSENLKFSSIGKNNTAHKIASFSFRNKKADYKVKLEDVLSLILLFEKS